ncbi:MAG: DNA alkylation repair protein [Candidatus Hatepunaea meridiana]|nr:DNA alkylation repair protein [Candidatus Hatepunaea meridiana]
MSIHPLITEIRSAYRSAANAENALAMRNYMKSEMLFHGVKSAMRKEINSIVFRKFKIISFAEYECVIRELWATEYREERYSAISFARKHKKFQTLDALPIYRMMIETGAWWDFVDEIAAHLIGNMLQTFPAEMKEELKRWIKDDNLWIRRTAILAQLRFKKDTDHEMLFDFCRQCLDEKTFWIRKAIGWALRQYSKDEPDRVREFFNKYRDRMSTVTLKEVVKYI